MHFKVLDFPIVSYKEILDLQHRIVQYKINNPAWDDFLITLEHRPVYTIGKHANFNNLKIGESTLKTKDIELIKSDRGGDITYHCPGQLTLYTIVNLKNIKKSLKNFVNLLEDVIIEALNDFSIKSYKLNNLHGVFTEHGKIASIGLACKRMVVYHGVSINVNNDLEPFNWINPCGLKNINMVNMKAILKQNIEIAKVKKTLLNILKNKIKWDIEKFNYNDLQAIIGYEKTLMA
jgi:lipoate-protein ligase B